jgi:hypothetical protein
VTPDSPEERLHAPFRSVRGRRVATWVAVAQGLVFAGLALRPPGATGFEFGWYDRLGFLVVGAGVAWVLSRFALVGAVPTPGGLAVRNLVTRRELAWPQVVDVRFPDGDPWVTLDLSDGETLPVMAIQRADGAHGREEASRLATLIAFHSRTERDD